MPPSLNNSTAAMENTASPSTTTRKASSSLDTTVSLVSCSATQLADWLLQHRFSGNVSATEAFLRQAATDIASSSTRNNDNTSAAISAPTKAAAAATETTASSNDLGSVLAKEAVEASFITPRTKFQMTFYSKGIECVDKKQERLQIPAGSVQHCIVFPKPEDCLPVSTSKKKDAMTDQLLLVLNDKAGVVYKGKTLTQVCLALPRTLPERIASNDNDEDDNEDEDGLDHTDRYTRWFSTSLALNVHSLVRIANPAGEKSQAFWRWQFSSHQQDGVSSTTGGMPFVKCYSGVHDGALYPLQEGLLFFKPPQFYPRSQLASIACGRAGSTNSRYVDLQVTLEQDKRIEFTNISRCELTVLREYIHKVLIPAMHKDANNDDNDQALAPEDMENSTSSVEVVNEKQEASTEEESERPGKRARRQASDEAREASLRLALGADEDEDEDDADFELDGDGDDDEEEEDETEDEEEEVVMDEATESEDEEDD